MSAEEAAHIYFCISLWDDRREDEEFRRSRRGRPDLTLNDLPDEERAQIERDWEEAAREATARSADLRTRLGPTSRETPVIPKPDTGLYKLESRPTVDLVEIMVSAGAG